MKFVRFGSLLAAVALVAIAARAGAQQGSGVAVGQKVPDKTFTQLLNNDGRMSIESLRGKVVVVDFWGNH